jgi:hypothetical protein
LKTCCIAFTVFFLGLSGQALAQKQLVLIKGERVVLRLYPGDEITYKLKGSDEKITSYVNNLFDNAVVTHDDTVYFHTIDRLYFSQPKFHNRLGAALIVGGIGLFVIDELNQVVVRGEKPDIDSFVSKASISALAVGIPLVLIKKKSQRMNFRFHLMTVRKGSLFYVPDRSGYMSPFIDN